MHLDAACEFEYTQEIVGVNSLKPNIKLLQKRQKLISVLE